MDMDLEQKAIMRLREAADTSERFYKAPLIVTTSGGKDSSVCVALAEKAGIDFEVMHNHTTVDAPETVYFIRREFKRLEEKGVKCTVNYPHYKGERVTMWSLIPQKLMPPTRLVRYCCSILMANLQAAVAEAVSGTMEERGRGFASDREAWAELKECIERTKQMHTDIEKVHKEMWSAVKDRNEDAFAALSQEFERSSRILAEEWAQTSALAKIAVISESND